MSGAFFRIFTRVIYILIIIMRLCLGKCGTLMIFAQKRCALQYISEEKLFMLINVRQPHTLTRKLAGKCFYI